MRAQEKVKAINAPHDWYFHWPHKGHGNIKPKKMAHKISRRIARIYLLTEDKP
jgi:hypothetical protein